MKANMEMQDGGCCSNVAIAHTMAMPESREMM
jgi:hypothetical protein